MPRVIVKLWPGKSEQQKTRLAEAITKEVMDILHYGEESVSVAMEEAKSQDWVEKVYKPEIRKKWEKLYKKSKQRAQAFHVGARPPKITHLIAEQLPE
jgi:4-oxalocrotonate tautomerase